MTEEKLFALQELWGQAGEKPFDAINSDKVKIHCCGIAPNGSYRAVGWTLRDRDRYGDSNCWSQNDIIWKFYKPEPKLVGYWFAVTKQEDIGMGHAYGLFSSETDAKACHGDAFIKLCKELPPIMLPEKESK